MKRHLWIVFLALITCAALFSGCALIKGLEKDVEITLFVGDESIGTYTVSTFKNAVVPEPQAAMGMKFAGWTPQANWADVDLSEVFVTENTTLLRYDEIKDYVGKDGKLSMYAVFAPIPQHDIAIAWYRAQGQSTNTGLTEEVMATFEQSLHTYLTSLGKTPAEMDIVIRPYDGSVAVSCAAIKKDGDIDIMVGWAGNISSNGGLVEGEDFLENVGGISIGTVSRSAARLNDKELTNQVYSWIRTTYDATQNVQPPQDGKVEGKDNVIIAWYNNSASGIDEQDMTELKTKLIAYLVTQGYTESNLNIVTRAYDGNVATSTGNIRAHGDVDIMVGWNTTSNLESNGFKQGVDFIENVGSIKIDGSTSRYAARLTDTDLTKLVYQWIQDEYGPKQDPEPDTPPAGKVEGKDNVIIAWYDLFDTAGIKAEDMETLKTNLTAYLVTKDFAADNLNIVIRAYTGSVGESGAEIRKHGDVDIMVGWAATSNLTSKGGFDASAILENVGDINIGTKARYSARLTDTYIVKLAYVWIQNTYGAGGVPEPTPDGQTPEVPDNPDVPTTTYKIVIGWYSKTGTSGLTTGIMNKFKAALEAYLQSAGYDLTDVNIDIRDCGDGDVASVGTKVNTEGDYDLIFGMGGNITSTGKIAVKKDSENNQYLQNVTMGTKARNIAIVDGSENALAIEIWNWLVGTNDDGWLYSQAAQEVGIYIPQA